MSEQTEPKQVVRLKRFVAAISPLDNVLTHDEAVVKANEMVLSGKAKKMVILEIVETIEPFTRVVPFTEG
jgi:hypothetical protein